MGGEDIADWRYTMSSPRQYIYKPWMEKNMKNIILVTVIILIGVVCGNLYTISKLGILKKLKISNNI